jgi:hypothetical protein
VSTPHPFGDQKSRAQQGTPLQLLHGIWLA